MAFLDVMACGLGASVLLFLIVKHHAGLVTEPVAAEQTSAVDESAAVAASRREAAVLAARIADARRRSRERRTRDEARAAAGRARLAELEGAIELAEAGNTALRNDVESIESARANDVIEDRRNGEERYLLGLKVEGRRIAILLDRSASMTDERLIDIISRKIRPDAEKRKGPKWQRALRAARWLLHRLPAKSRVAVVAFNDRATALHGGRWAEGRDAAALERLFGELDDLIPTGATNLEAGLRALDTFSPAVTDVYVVTDGLPTQSMASGGLSSGCGGTTARVSGACRKELFYASLRRSAPAAGKKVHVILLPLEGDPEAAPAYWIWTAQAGGLLLTPARGWP